MVERLRSSPLWSSDYVPLPYGRATTFLSLMVESLNVPLVFVSKEPRPSSPDADEPSFLALLCRTSNSSSGRAHVRSLDLPMVDRVINASINEIG
jgi:hypothetical protein